MNYWYINYFYLLWTILIVILCVTTFWTYSIKRVRLQTKLNLKFCPLFLKKSMQSNPNPFLSSVSSVCPAAFTFILSPVEIIGVNFVSSDSWGSSASPGSNSPWTVTSCCCCWRTGCISCIESMVERSSGRLKLVDEVLSTILSLRNCRSAYEFSAQIKQ